MIPAILESQRSLSLDKEKTGWFGRGGTERRREWRTDQFTEKELEIWEVKYLKTARESLRKT